MPERHLEGTRRQDGVGGRLSSSSRIVDLQEANTRLHDSLESGERGRAGVHDFLQVMDAKGHPISLDNKLDSLKTVAHKVHLITGGGPGGTSPDSYG
jgi:hypothetical protein